MFLFFEVRKQTYNFPLLVEIFKLSLKGTPNQQN